MKHSRKLAIVILVLAFAPATLFADAALDSIVAASDSLQTFSCTVSATQGSGRNATTIELTFEFKRDPARMRIEYLAPRNMKGSIVAMDGTYFYNYMPNLNRTQKQRLGSSSSSNPGEDMGVLFDYVQGDLDHWLAGQSATFDGVETTDVTVGDETDHVSARHYTFASGNARQEVWFSEDGQVPVRIDIYDRRSLVRTIQIDGVTVNGAIDDSRFSL